MIFDMGAKNSLFNKLWLGKLHIHMQKDEEEKEEEEEEVRPSPNTIHKMSSKRIKDLNINYKIVYLKL